MMTSKLMRQSCEANGKWDGWMGLEFREKKRKLNVLDELDEIKMCVAYELDGEKLDYLPAAVEDQIKIKPIYKSFPGWKVSTSGIKNMDSLPDNAKKYIFAVEDFIGEIESFNKSFLCSISSC